MANFWNENPEALELLIQLNEKRNEEPKVYTSQYIADQIYKTFGYKIKANSVRQHISRLKGEAKKFNIQFSELAKESTKIAKQKQKYQDTNRIERATWRNIARTENAAREYYEKVMRVLEVVNLSKITKKHNTYKNEYVGVLQVSDTHFNELISLPQNTYDFTIAGKRLKKFAIEAKKVFKAFDISTLLVAFTGDILNSDRRLDERLNQATNRSRASILSVYLLEQFLLDLNQDFNLHIDSVVGNESRVDPEMGYSEIVMTNNYSYEIYEMLRMLFRGCKGIDFAQCGYAEKPININGSTFLLTHGISKKNSNLEKDIQQTMGRWSAKGQTIDYVILGHLHSSRCGDYFSRSSSLPGSNDYNENALNLIGRSAQNIYVVGKNKSINSMRIDLQYTGDIEGYDILNELEMYNAKSAQKLQGYNKIRRII